MIIIEHSRYIKTSDIVVVEDITLNVKWFIEINTIDGRMVSITESINYDYFTHQGLEYMNTVYTLAINYIRELNKK